MQSMATPFRGDEVLEDIPGIGEATAQKIRDYGTQHYDILVMHSDEDLIEMFEEIDAPSIDSESMVSTIREHHETVEERRADEAQEKMAGTYVPDRIEMSMELDPLLYKLCVHALLEQSLKNRQSNDQRGINKCEHLASDLIAAGPIESEQSVSFQSSMGELNEFNRALSASVGDLRGRRGITGIWGDLRNVVEALDDLRAENWESQDRT